MHRSPEPTPLVKELLLEHYLRASFFKKYKILINIALSMVCIEVKSKKTTNWNISAAISHTRNGMPFIGTLEVSGKEEPKF